MSDWCRRLTQKAVLPEIILSPVLLGQALLLRRRMVKLPEAHGARRGITGTGPRLRLLIIGDSSAAGVGAQTQEKALLGCVLTQLRQDFTVHYSLVATTGARTADALDWLDDLPRESYDVVVTALGVNDVTRLTAPSRFAAQQTALFARLVSDFGAQLILVSDIPPMGRFPALPQPLRWAVGRQANRLGQRLRMRIMAQKITVLLPFAMDLDPGHMASDGFHPGPDIYAAWGLVVGAAIKAQMPQLDDSAAAP